MSDFPDHPFWDFSLRVYMTPGVGPACVELQAAHELDVNVVLWCLWMGASGRGSMTGAEMRGALDAIDPWHNEVVRALRAVRTRMKGGMPPSPDARTESLRQRIQKIEIDCEHNEQLMLAGAVDRPADEGRAEADRLSDSAANVGLYCRERGYRLSAADRGHFAAILAVAYPEQDRTAVESAAAGLK